MKTRIFPLLGLLFLGVPSLFPQEKSTEVSVLSVEKLRCEYLKDPLGIDAVKPRLSWILESGGLGTPERGQRQTAYRVLVASTPESLAKEQGDLWDSGKVESDRSTQVEYAGKPLESRMPCYWKVRVWDQAGKASEWSKAAMWSMGLLKPDDWKAKWIGLTQAASTNTITPPRTPLVIRKAVYGTSDGRVSKDVTLAVAGMMKDNTLRMVVSNDALGGDPADNQVKYLRVEYEIDGHAGVLQRREKEELLLPEPSGKSEEQEWPTPRYLRKGFSLSGDSLRKAVLHVTALGLYEIQINGKKVGDHLLAPEWTDYHKRVQYQTYDVTEMVRKGPNVLAAILGNGWYCGGWQRWKPKLAPLYGTEPFLLAQLELEFADGSTQVVATDNSWRGTTEGPLRFAGIYEGETYDATRLMTGWDEPGFDDLSWRQVNVAPDTLAIGKLVMQRSDPIRKTTEVRPLSVTEVHPGVYVFAFEQNLAGWCRFTLHGKAGKTIELQHGEMLNPDGTVFLENLLVVSKHRIQLDQYTFRGEGKETFEPHFTYHGFQYVQVCGLSEKPRLDSLVAEVFHSNCPEVGTFSCSNPKINRLAENILWSQRANFMGVPTDCPQRNERCGYAGDAQFFMPTAIYNMDVAAFYNKCLVDLCQDSANEKNGAFSDHMPDIHSGGYGNVGWGDAGIICPYLFYRIYGDRQLLAEHYEAMRRHMEFWVARTGPSQIDKGGIRNSSGPRDWLNLHCPTKSEVIATAYFAYLADLMTEIAKVTNHPDDAKRYARIAAETRQAFATTFIKADRSILGSSQTGYALAFTMGLVPDSMRREMSDGFAAEIHKYDDHLATGFIGTPRLLPGLHAAGRDDLAYRLLLTETKPSWLYPVTVGATTMWERWDAWDGKHAKGGMNSLNHYAFGSVGEYLYGMIGGIQAEEPGYKKIRIAPVIEKGLTWAKVSYDSIRGKIVSNWSNERAKLTMEVTIPPNTTATIHVPTSSPDQVQESGLPLSKAKGIKILRAESGVLLLEVGSGSYQFTTTFYNPTTQQ